MVIDYFWGYPWVPYFQTTANDKNRGFATSAGLIRCQSKKKRHFQTTCSARNDIDMDQK